MDKEKNVKNANEALDLAKKQALKIDFILEQITSAAQAGCTFTSFINLIDPKARIELMDMGFMFGTIKDSYDQKMTKISWAEE